MHPEVRSLWSTARDLQRLRGTALMPGYASHRITGWCSDRVGSPGWGSRSSVRHHRCRLSLRLPRGPQRWRVRAPGSFYDLEVDATHAEAMACARLGLLGPIVFEYKHYAGQATVEQANLNTRQPALAD